MKFKVVCRTALASLGLVQSVEKPWAAGVPQGAAQRNSRGTDFLGWPWLFHSCSDFLNPVGGVGWDFLNLRKIPKTGLRHLPGDSLVKLHGSKPDSTTRVNPRLPLPGGLNLR